MRIADVARGYTFGASEQVTNTKLHLLVDDATVSNIVNADVAAGAAIESSKLNFNLSDYVTIAGSQTITGAKTFSASAAFAALSATDITCDSVDTDTLNLGTTNQGDILYDNGTSITRLTPGTSGQFLKTQGAAANPTWATSISGFNNVQAFTSSGTWTRPAGVNTVYVKAWGRGGSGSSSSGNAGGGGGAGGYAEGYIDVSGNVSVVIDSTSSRFPGNTTLTANKGSNASGTTGGNGGTAIGGDVNISGGSGETGQSESNVQGGSGGSSPLGGSGGRGACGQSTSSASRNAYNGHFPGGGGGGAATTDSVAGSGGSGGGGLVLVYWAE